ncbi:hypothetical protein KK062_05865 [Fulvivirgaceae bacterium PWU5]|uniref:Uncharacterized protein n=1 Tax=Dawidia cretensis TaxID=2782350 RepID=A0AAP2DUE9_9BACT|nr:hypothetical protein [Dawidia cretensis]MBT1707735.1 hypothetical protein [Dawidia cretensis]
MSINLPPLPTYIPWVFAITTVLTIYLFCRSIHYPGSQKDRHYGIIICLLAWLALQTVLTLKGIYNTDTAAMPPRIFALGLFPPLLTVILLFATKAGRQFVDGLSLPALTWLHVIRIPVEIILFWLSIHQAIPQLMTFEGRNFDILAGITAPIVAYVGVTRGKLNKSVLLIWNILCLGLLLNIVVNAVLSAPWPLQQFAFDQPNVAILNFPYSWLPTCIVPIVLFAHLAAIRQLTRTA